ncbi:hypothetical protein D1B31_14775 [Neobacillus notoginsengisoli]|uniref:Lipoprotein n=1 Tax=Neobacillus notoginsengisoli TaxID=1578198 RepID=A0A417YRW9_9BACI|nr:hypothetical protein [Neobacillus notoginsengisoli]RHW38043.1 hypothetical protein D1B31_14775 [Neobacillus notoginsengisoli]
MKKFIVPLTLLFLLLAGCQDTNLEKNLPKPEFTLGSKEVETITGSYAWSQKGKADEADKGKPEDLAKELKAVQAAAGDSIDLHFSIEPTSLQTAVLNPDEKKPALNKVKDGSFSVPDLSEGKHDILVKANFYHGHADYVFKINVEKVEPVVTDFVYPQLLPVERHTYSMLAIGPQSEKNPLETNKQVIQYVNEILSLENSKQAKIIYPDLELKSDPCYVLFDQKGPVFQSASLEELITFIDANKP